MTIGEYTISPCYTPGFDKPTGYWVTHKSGEGMLVAAEKVEKLIRDFFNREF